MPRVLIIAYGNPLRCDDGLAWRAADQLEGKFSGSVVELLPTHQLTPELAAAVSRSDGVIFVDAASAEEGNAQPGEVHCAPIGLPEGKVRFSHQLSPSSVIALARELYAASPRAFSVTVTGQCFDHGESFSPVVAAALPVLVTRIETLVRELLSAESFPRGSDKP